MPRMGTPGGSKIRFEITSDRPEDDPSRLAVELAEILTKISRKNQDQATFKAGAIAERTKAQQLQEIIFKLKERKRTGEVSTSRMDPLNEYDLEKCQAEFDLLKERAKEMQKESDQYGAEVKELEIESRNLQRKIHNINSKLRQKDADK